MNNNIIGLVFSGSVGDELNTIPIVKALHKKYECKISIFMRFANEIYKTNPYAIIGASCNIKMNLRFAEGQELSIHMIDHYAKLLNVELVDRNMDLFLTVGDKVIIDSKLLNYDKIVAIDPSAGWPSRQWGVDNWNVLCDELSSNGWLIIQVGKTWRDCFGNVQKIRINSHYNFVDKLSLRQSAYMLSKCKAYIGNDSGCAHLAAAVAIPNFVIYGPVHPKSRVHSSTIPVYSNACNVCNLIKRSEVCPKKENTCLKTITVDNVLNKVERYFS